MGRKKTAETVRDDTPVEQTVELASSAAAESQPVTSPSTPIKMVDAARAALAEGIESVDEALPYIKQRFGIDFPKEYWASYRSQIRNKERDKLDGGDRNDMIDDLSVVKRMVKKLGAKRVHQLVGLFE